jgi:hypothetical protein
MVIDGRGIVDVERLRPLNENMELLRLILENWLGVGSLGVGSGARRSNDKKKTTR